jgi:Undecaprenyl-phosphate glucose phosphotransferase
LHELRHQTITTRLLLDIFGLNILNSSISKLAGFPVLNVRSSPMIGGNRLIKALEDRFLAGIILLLISPLFLLIPLAVKLSSPGPVFYRQKRISWNGKEFDMLKFRTMPVDAEAITGPVWAREGEQRATKIGAFLRKTSLDELPQFINVLLGDMSIVGPRPERHVFVEEFKEKIPGYMQKHLVKAGITGWAQVNGWRGNTSLEKRIEYDLYYIENWSFLFDLKIIFLTCLQGFVNKNAY